VRALYDHPADGPISEALGFLLEHQLISTSRSLTQLCQKLPIRQPLFRVRFEARQNFKSSEEKAAQRQVVAAARFLLIVSAGALLQFVQSSQVPAHEFAHGHRRRSSSSLARAV
jgi:hypothetical protein